MTALPDDLFDPLTPANPAATRRPCPHPRAARGYSEIDEAPYCGRCGKRIDPEVARRGRNSRKRGGKAELDVAKAIGGEKVGPLGHPWDVVVAGLWRIQVRKYLTPQGLRKIARELATIAKTPGPEAPAYVWVEPGRGGEQLIVMRLKDFTAWTGVEVSE